MTEPVARITHPDGRRNPRPGRAPSVKPGARVMVSRRTARRLRTFDCPLPGRIKAGDLSSHVLVVVDVRVVQAAWPAEGVDQQASTVRLRASVGDALSTVVEWDVPLACVALVAKAAPAPA